MLTERVSVFRGSSDKYGNPKKDPDQSVDGVFAWGGSRGNGARFTQSNDRRESSAINVDFYVARGTNLRARDRLKRSNGEEYAVIGHALWDQQHPMDGFDFGWMVFNLESLNG
ncbi:Uncharacterised protein [Mycobacteroides abscessus subsp. abscessus]|uniref:hypothetical protein n=1 Tax=Mycobacteroides abscessus TaxID=36809 RepID=UPI0009A8FA03|nr:hypothetical protein [Mycobacteroides abscessus]SKU47272.1 Uncharacterised protein [Mycobacteroides abscessus subsp. abscessus]